MKRPDKRKTLDTQKKEEIAQAYRLIYRGKLTKEFLTGDLWVKFLDFYFNDELDRLEKECRFDPSRGDSPSIEKLALLNSLHSGSINFIENFLQELRSWVTMGEEASEKIKREKQNEKN